MINIGVIGCGYWGVHHVRVFNELSDSTVTRVCDLRTERLGYIKQRYPLINTHSLVQELIEDELIDAVVISTEATTHYELARQALSAGKHVLVEKPLTTSVEEAEDLIRLSREASRVLMVGHTFLFNSGIQKMKELLTQRDFGVVYYLHSTRTNLGPIRWDISAVWDLAPHDISIFNYLLDAKPTRVSAVGSPLLGNDRHDVAFITLTYPGGVIGNIHVGWADPNKVRELVVVGSNKRMVFNDLNNQEQVRIFEKGVAVSEQQADSFGEFRFLIRDGDIISPRIEAHEPLRVQGLHFLACIKEKKRPLSDGTNGAEVVRAMMAIDSSLRRFGEPMEVVYADQIGNWNKTGQERNLGLSVRAAD